MRLKFFAIVSAGVFVQCASAAMPAAQQNALIQKYCAVCHNDAHLNGGLSLQHFDAAHPDPGVAAMIMSKLTNVSLEAVKAAQTDPAATALMAKSMKNGAMGAAGVPVPDRATQDALVSALSSEADGASEWVVSRTAEPPAVTASILREVPSATDKTAADMYRLTLTCSPETHVGEMQVTWAPGAPRKGFSISASADGAAPVTYTVEDTEKMFRGTTVTSGSGVVLLARSGWTKPGIPLPEKTLAISNVFPNESVEFSLDGLPQAVHRQLSSCFNRTAASK